MEFRVIGLNINNDPPAKISDSNAKSLGLSKEFLENEFNDTFKKVNRHVTLQLQDLLNIYGRYGWEHYFQGQVGSLITLYFRRERKIDGYNFEGELSPQEKSMLQSLDIEQMP